MNREHVLVIRLGAYGDCLIITPVLKRLKQQGHKVTVLTSERGRELFENYRYLDRLEYQESDKVATDYLNHYWTEVKHKVKADRTINFSESIEVALALHPRDPRYNYPKEERKVLCNRNYYEFTMEWAGFKDWTPEELRPNIEFTHRELKKARSHIRNGKFNVLVCMSGSGKHKAWPWWEILFGSMLNEYPDVHIITVGDYKCKLLESHEPNRITNLAGEIPMRHSLALSGMVDCVISPDTGVLHASAMYPHVPKIALLGHTTAENITKHIPNCISIEADENKAECSPCFKLVYNMPLQCPQDVYTKAAYCMAKGIEPERVFEAFQRIRGNEKTNDAERKEAEREKAEVLA